MNKISYALTTAALFVSCGLDAKNIHTLEVEAFAETIGQGRLMLVDVRAAEEYAQGHLEGAVNVDVNQPDFVEQIFHVAEDTPVAVYCLRGSRSLRAASLLAKEGREVYNLAGGITAWKNEGRPITTR